MEQVDSIADESSKSTSVFSSSLSGIILAIGIFLFPFIYFIYTLFLSQVEKTRYFGFVVANYSIFIFLSFILAFIITALYNKKNNLLRNNKEIIFITLLLLNILYAIYLFIISMERYVTFSSQAIDVPYFHYALVQLSHFQIPKIWDIPTRYVWADHFSPILILLTPIYWIAQNGTLLMISEISIVLSGTIPLYHSAKHLLRSRFIALALVTSYLTFGGLQWGYAYGFHEIVLFPTFFLWMYYFYIKKKMWPYFLFAILTLSIKEEVVFIMAFWGMYTLAFHKNKAYSMGTILLAGFWYILCFNIVFPYFNQGSGFGYWGQYNDAGGKSGIVGLTQTALLRPGVFLQSLITPAYKIDTIFHIFAPFAFLPILYPPAILIILPSLLEKLLSNTLPSYIGAHYTSAIAGVTMVACIEALQYLLKGSFLFKKVFLFRQKIFWGTVIIYCATSAGLFYGYAPLSPINIFRQDLQSLSYIESLSLQKAIEMVPKNASVSAHAILIPHFNKPLGMIKHGPLPNDDADYIIWDNRLPDYFYKDNIEKIMNSLVDRKKYELILYENAAILLKRIR